MPGSVQFLIDKNLKELQPFADEIEKKRVKVIESHADKDDKGEFITVENEKGLKEFTYKTDEDKQKAVDEINKEMLIEYELPIHQIPLSLYSEVKVQTKNVVGQDILFDIYIDETK
jgi:hypothetical protein